MELLTTLKKGLYQHFKGGYYKVIDIAKHSETEEELVVYQSLSGDKRLWVRPVSMFNEIIERDCETVQRFTYCLEQTEILEVAILDVVEAKEFEFEKAFSKAQKIISGMQGYISHRLERCLEKQNRYILLVEWQTLEDHTVGFRESAEYQEWQKLLHHYYSPFPRVEHYQSISYE